MTVSTTEGSAYVMNPKPLGRPVCRSFIITLSITSPYFSKYLVNVSTQQDSHHYFEPKEKGNKIKMQTEKPNKYRLPNVVSLAKPPMKILLQEKQKSEEHQFRVSFEGSRDRLAAKETNRRSTYPGLAPSTSETPDFFGTMTELKRSNHDDGNCGRRCSGSQTRVRKIRA